MYYGNGYYESTGSIFDDRRELQNLLYNSRIPYYIKEQLIEEHNWRYIDSMSTDTDTNWLRYGYCFD